MSEEKQMPDRGLDDESRCPKPAYKLYPVRAVVLSTPIGGLLAGGVLMAVNYRQVGRRTAAAAAVAFGVVAVGLFLGFTLSTSPDNPLPGLTHLFVQPVVMYLIIRLFQGRMLSTHRAAAGDLESEWKAAGIGLVLGILIVLVGMVLETQVRGG